MRRSALQWKRIMTLVIVLLVGISVFAGGCSSPAANNTPSGDTQGTQAAPAPDKVFELSFAHFFPASDMIETDMVQVWIKRIEEATDNRVKITSYPGQTLVTSAETYQSVVEGAVDIGLSCHGYTRGKFPIIETFNLPGIASINTTASSYALQEAIDVLDPEELKDTKQLWSWGNSPGGIMMQFPVRKLEDLAGVEIGITAGPRADAFKMLGAVPVTMPVTEWYEALMRGLIKGGVAGLDTMKTFKTGEVTGDYITIAPFVFNQTFFVVMNKDVWNSLPTDIQEIIDRVTDEFFNEVVVSFWFDYAESAVEFVQSVKDIEFIELSDEEVARWMKLMEPVMDEHVAYLNDRGLPGEEILETVLAIVDKYNQEYGDIPSYKFLQH